MTSYERLMARLEGRPVDRVPNNCIIMGFGARYIGATYKEFVTDYRVLTEAGIRCREDFDLDILSAISDPMREAEGFGADVVIPEDAVPYASAPLVASLSDLTKLKVKDPASCARMNDRLLAVRRYAEYAQKDCAVQGWVEGGFAEACDLRDLNNMMMDIFDEPEAVAEMLDICTRQAEAFAAAQVEAGADIVGIGDAAASLIGPAMYEEFALPYDKKDRTLGLITRTRVSFNTDDYPGYHRMSIKIKRSDDNKAIDNVLIQPQLELGSTVTAYTPYTSTSTTTTLPTLAPLYSLPDGTADEYDAMTGVETRRIGVKVFDGTESIVPSPNNVGGTELCYAIADAFYSDAVSKIAISNIGVSVSRSEVYNKTNADGSFVACGFGYIRFVNAFTDADAFKAHLANRYAAGAPVTVLYKLAAPVITQHDTAAIQPLTPVCSVFADAGIMDVGYNRDINLAFQQLQNAIIAQGGMINV